MSTAGEVLRIYLRPAKREPVLSVDSVDAEISSGLRGDHKKGSGKRQVTILSREGWRAACAEVGADIDPRERRANIFVEGVDLSEAIGRELSLGPVRIEILGETDPCDRMDEAYDGLQDALRPDLRGGVFGRVVEAGKISVGDPTYLIQK